MRSVQACLAVVAVAAVMGLSGMAKAQAPATSLPNGMTPVTAECLNRAADNFGLPLPVMLGILRTEGGRVGMESRNTNGSYDLGPMQINDRVWVPEVAKRLHGGDQELARRLLRDSGCYNVAIGAWILWKQLQATDGDLAEAIGYYHSRTPKFKTRYQQKFAENYLSMFATGVGK